MAGVRITTTTWMTTARTTLVAHVGLMAITSIYVLAVFVVISVFVLIAPFFRACNHDPVRWRYTGPLSAPFAFGTMSDEGDKSTVQVTLGSFP